MKLELMVSLLKTRIRKQTHHKQRLLWEPGSFLKNHLKSIVSLRNKAKVSKMCIRKDIWAN